MNELLISHKQTKLYLIYEINNIFLKLKILIITILLFNENKSLPFRGKDKITAILKFSHKTLVQ
jgi:hypothetical protein